MHLNKKIWICLLPVVVTVSLLVGSLSEADVYDDFSSENIDTTKWMVRSTPGGTPGWNFSPQLFISGYPGATGLTKFLVDNVEYLPLPLPPPLLKRLER